MSSRLLRSIVDYSLLMCLELQVTLLQGELSLMGRITLGIRLLESVSDSFDSQGERDGGQAATGTFAFFAFAIHPSKIYDHHTPTTTLPRHHPSTTTGASSILSKLQSVSLSIATFRSHITSTALLYTSLHTRTMMRIAPAAKALAFARATATRQNNFAATSRFATLRMMSVAAPSVKVRTTMTTTMMR